MTAISEVTVREAKPSDLAALKRIADLSFPMFFRFFAAQSIAEEDGKLLLGELNGELVGFAKLIDFHIADRKQGCILWLAVHPNHRRKGVASTLVKAGYENLKLYGVNAVFASVQRTNKASLATFRKEGFHRVGFWGLRRLFGWHVFRFFVDIWYAPGEVVLMHE